MDQRLGPADGAATESSAFRVVKSSDRHVAPLPRRRVLRALPGAAVGILVLVGLAACGGEDDEDDEEDDD